jgi:hypothetical protein
MLIFLTQCVRMMNGIFLNVVMLNVIMPNGIFPNVIMLSVIMPIGIFPNVIMPLKTIVDMSDP